MFLTSLSKFGTVEIGFEDPEDSVLKGLIRLNFWSWFHTTAVVTDHNTSCLCIGEYFFLFFLFVGLDFSVSLRILTHLSVGI